MKRIILAGLCLAAMFVSPVRAQMSALTVGTCGTLVYDAGKYLPVTQDTTGLLCDKGGSGGGGATTANQGTPNTTANAWPVKNTDGTNTAAVKAASTAPSATDPALVVAVSPNGGQATAANQSTMDGHLTNVQSAPGSSATIAQGIQGVTGGVSVGTTDTGNVASGSADSGNPVKTGGVYNSTPPALTSGQRSDTQADVNGSTRVLITGNAISAVDAVSNGAIIYGQSGASSVTTNREILAGANHVFNGTSWDRGRSIQDNGTNTGLGVAAVAIAPNSALAGSIGPTVSAANATSLVLKASAGNYYDAYCYSSVAGNCILYNATTAPSAGAITSTLVLECVPVIAGGIGSITYNPGPPSRFSAGATLLFSSATGPGSCNTYTASSTAYLHGRVQ